MNSVASSQASSSGDIIMGSLSDGWDAFKDEWIIVYGIGIVFLIISGVLSAIGIPFRPEVGESPSTLYILYQMISSAVQIILGGGLSYALLGILRGDSTAVGNRVFAGVLHAVPLLVATVLISIATVFGFLLLIIPGIVISLGLSQTYYLILDQDLGAVEALKASWVMMRGYKLSFFLFGLASTALVLISVIPLGLGLLVSIPTVALASAAFYDRLSAASA